jgi:solute carrier family 25 (mitochondrial phosphate transporter), member 3
MDLSEKSRQSLFPSYLYTSSASKAFGRSSKSTDLGSTGSFIIPAPNESRKIEMFSPAYYAACTTGGILSCGLTHMAVTPLDLVKCNMQVSCFYSFISDFWIFLAVRVGLFDLKDVLSTINACMWLLRKCI